MLEIAQPEPSAIQDLAYDALDRPEELDEPGRASEIVAEAWEGRAPDLRRFYDEVARHLAEAGEILVTGPGTAKTELIHHLEEKHPAVARRVVKVETLDHPTDGQLLALARKQFKAIDRMLPRS